MGLFFSSFPEVEKKLHMFSALQPLKQQKLGISSFTAILNVVAREQPGVVPLLSYVKKAHSKR